jgi:tubulin-specific chaperone A
MPAPSKLVIAASSVQRLVKEEASYRKEQKQQEERIENFQGTDENAEFLLNQEVFHLYK